jgi:hypothetical protein
VQIETTKRSKFQFPLLLQPPARAASFAKLPKLRARNTIEILYQEYFFKHPADVKSELIVKKRGRKYSLHAKN